MVIRQSRLVFTQFNVRVRDPIWILLIVHVQFSYSSFGKYCSDSDPERSVQHPFHETLKSR